MGSYSIGAISNIWKIIHSTEQEKKMTENYYWKVTPRMHIALILIGLVGFGFLLSMFKYTNEVWAGYIASGIILWLGYKWEYIENHSL